MSNDSEPAKHFKENLSHKFSWKILFVAPENKQIHKVLDSSEMALKRARFNEQIESKKLLSFRNCVHENLITFNCNYVYIQNFNHFNICVSKSFYYSTDDVLLQKAFTDILNCCDIYFTYILLLLCNLKFHTSAMIRHNLQLCLKQNKENCNIIFTLYFTTVNS